MELLKIQELREYTRNSRIGTKLTEVVLLPKEKEIVDFYGSLIVFGQKLSQCEQTRCQQRTQLRKERDRLKREYDRAIVSLKKEIRARRARDDVFLDPKNLSGTAKKIIQAQPGTVLIYPFVLEDKLWLLWAAPGKLVSKREIAGVGQKQLTEKVVKFRQMLQDRNSDLKELQRVSQQLYQWLIAPIEDELLASSLQHLVFSLDRASRYIPMAALFDGEKYLIEKYTVTTILSAELTDTESRLPSGTEKVNVLALGTSEPIDGFNALPHVVREIDAIVLLQDPKDRKGIYPGIQFLNSEFDFTTMRDHLEGRQILHVATHGKFVPGSQENSYILMGDGEKLPISEIKVLENYLDDVHIVVLSACETALGGTDNEGIEIPGISSYFLGEGKAKTTIASLWQVDDLSTSLLMERLYHYLASNSGEHPMTKAEALRQAQLSLLEDRQLDSRSDNDRGGIVSEAVAEQQLSRRSLAHPYYWAPFILIGNGL